MCKNKKINKYRSNTRIDVPEGARKELPVNYIYIYMYTYIIFMLYYRGKQDTNTRKILYYIIILQQVILFTKVLFKNWRRDTRNNDIKICSELK